MPERANYVDNSVSVLYLTYPEIEITQRFVRQQFIDIGMQSVR